MKTIPFVVFGVMIALGIYFNSPQISVIGAIFVATDYLMNRYFSHEAYDSVIQQRFNFISDSINKLKSTVNDIQVFRATPTDLDKRMKNIEQNIILLNQMFTDLDNRNKHNDPFGG